MCPVPEFLAPARRQQVTNPQNTIFSIKRFMGRKFDEVSSEIKQVPYKVERASNGDVRIDAEGKSYLTIAVGCTGGRHRSVAVSEAVAAMLAGMAVFENEIAA